MSARPKPPRKVTGPRYVAKVFVPGRRPVWGVYDRLRGSWPRQVGDRVIRQDYVDELEAQVAAKELCDSPLEFPDNSSLGVYRVNVPAESSSHSE